MTTENIFQTLRTATTHWELNNRSEAHDYRHLDTRTANRLIAIDLESELQVLQGELTEAQEAVTQAEEELVIARSAYDRVYNSRISALANRG